MTKEWDFTNEALNASDNFGHPYLLIIFGCPAFLWVSANFSSINASDATTSALANTATGNAAANLISQNTSLSNNKIQGITTAVVGVAEGFRKVYSEVSIDDKPK